MSYIVNGKGPAGWRIDKLSDSEDESQALGLDFLTSYVAFVREKPVADRIVALLNEAEDTSPPAQPAPTDDQKALRAAAMEAQHDPVKVARVLELAAATDCGNHWNSDGDPCAAETCLHCRAGELLPELRCRCGKFSLDRSTPSLWEGGATPAPINHAPDECATPAPAKHCPTCAQTVPDGRVLAGSPAQQGQLTKENIK